MKPIKFRLSIDSALNIDYRQRASINHIKRSLTCTTNDIQYTCQAKFRFVNLIRLHA